MFDQKVFNYNALSAKGEPLSGTVAARTEAEALEQLRNNGMYPTQIEESYPDPGPAKPKPVGILQAVCWWFGICDNEKLARIQREREEAAALTVEVADAKYEQQREEASKRLDERKKLMARTTDTQLIMEALAMILRETDNSFAASDLADELTVRAKAPKEHPHDFGPR